MTKTEKLLCELIALPSVNPAFLPHENPRAGEHRVADFLAATAAQSGLDVEFQQVSPGRSNLLARVRPAGTIRHRVILAPHLDTINAADEMFHPRISGGRVYGRGACDTKGSVASMFQAVCEVVASGPRPAETEIVFAALVDEEHAQSGSRALAAHGPRADLAIVGEPTRCQVVTAHKGSLWLRLETRGKSAHGSRPDLGQSAVHAMAKVVDFLETQYASHLRKRKHPILGHPTVSVGVIAGGTQPNVVPDHCAIEVDRRTLPAETEASAMKELSATLRQAGLKASLTSMKSAECLPLETNPGLPLVREFLRTARQRDPLGANYFCDAAVLSAGGTPSVVFGPGDIAQAHTADEWVSLASLERAREVLTRFLRSLA